MDQSNRKEWRKAILRCARGAADALPGGWDADAQFEVVALLYLTKGKQLDKHDVDNRLKDILDGLQGAFAAKKDGKTRAEDRVIKNDRNVWRVVIEKQKLPKVYSNRDNPPGGRLLIRPYEIHRWPLQATKAAKSLRGPRDRAVSVDHEI